MAGEEAADGGQVVEAVIEAGGPDAVGGKVRGEGVTGDAEEVRGLGDRELEGERHLQSRLFGGPVLLRVGQEPRILEAADSRSPVECRCIAIEPTVDLRPHPLGERAQVHPRRRIRGQEGVHDVFDLVGRVGPLPVRKRTGDPYSKFAPDDARCGTDAREHDAGRRRVAAFLPSRARGRDGLRRAERRIERGDGVLRPKEKLRGGFRGLRYGEDAGPPVPDGLKRRFHAGFPIEGCEGFIAAILPSRGVRING